MYIQSASHSYGRVHLQIHPGPDPQKIPFSFIQSAFEIWSTTLKEQENFNTHHHSHHDISLLVPELPHSKPENSTHDPWILLSPWLGLISLSQGFNPETDIHRILLPKIFCTRVLRASTVALIMGRIATSDEEDLIESFPQTTTDGTLLDSLFSQNQTKKFFFRMDPCSLKDAVIGQGPVKNVRDLWTRLATSTRGTTGIASILSLPVAEEQPVYMYLLPWREIWTQAWNTGCSVLQVVLEKSVRFRNIAGTNHGTTPSNPTKIKEKLFKEFGEVYRIFTPS